jgi:hypothetical protein
MVTEKVEIGFDLTANNQGPFLKLDDPVHGRLDQAEWTLGGEVFFDVTPRVRGYSIGRGKSRQLDRYSAGVASVTLDNNDRYFDPTYAASPYYGQIIPRRQVRITSNGIQQYYGLVDDWNLNFAPQGDSTAEAQVSDGFTLLAQQTLGAQTATAQLSGARINAILDSADVLWPTDRRDIDSGEQMLVADVIPDDAPVLQYLQLVETTEFGRLFISKSGDVVFRDRNGINPSSASLVTFADDGTGIKYVGLQVVYGSELLYNQVVATNYGGSQVTANDSDSQSEYGIFTLTQDGLLMDDASTIDWALYNVNQYSQPEFRFERLDVNLQEISTEEATAVLGLEIGSVVKISFTPNGIAPAIEKYAEVIAIAHDANITTHRVSLGFATLDYASFILDDAVFGKLDTGTLSL